MLHYICIGCGKYLSNGDLVCPECGSTIICSKEGLYAFILMLLDYRKGY